MTVSAKALYFRSVCLPHLFVHLFAWTDTVTMISHECLEQFFDKTEIEYIVAPIGDVIRFWRSKH